MMVLQVSTCVIADTQNDKFFLHTGGTRDEVIDTNERLRACRIRLEESYDMAKKSLVNLMNKYGDSKSQKNIFNRYPLLKIMIKVSVST